MFFTLALRLSRAAAASDASRAVVGTITGTVKAPNLARQPDPLSPNLRTFDTEKRDGQ